MFKCYFACRLGLAVRESINQSERSIFANHYYIVQYLHYIVDAIAIGSPVHFERNAILSVMINRVMRPLRPIVSCLSENSCTLIKVHPRDHKRLSALSPFCFQTFLYEELKEQFI